MWYAWLVPGVVKVLKLLGVGRNTEETRVKPSVRCILSFTEPVKRPKGKTGNFR
jgi:hypothetical protein